MSHMDEINNLFGACVRAGYNGRNSASFVGKIVTFCLLHGVTEETADSLLRALAVSAPSGLIDKIRVAGIMELCPLLAQVIADSQNLSTVGQLRGMDIGFETVFHAVIEYKVKH